MTVQITIKCGKFFKRWEYQTQYIQQGYTELSLENLPELIKLKYGTINDAKTELGSLGEINKVFIDFQKELYAA